MRKFFFYSDGIVAFDYSPDGEFSADINNDHFKNPKNNIDAFRFFRVHKSRAKYKITIETIEQIKD